MDTKAANSGDRMKHPLSQEVLIRTDGWKFITYAETHAGAGTYLDQHQHQDHYIADLRAMLERRAKLVLNSRHSSNAGSAYFDLLRTWWSRQGNLGKYPGGAMQAALCLQDRREVGTFQLKLAEKDQATCQRLRESLRGVANTEIRQSSFYDEREWLTHGDYLVLVVDPFRCVAAFDGPLSDGLDEGHIDHQIVSSFLAECEAKEAAVIHFWWPSRSQSGGGVLDRKLCESQRLVRVLFARWECGHACRRVREYSNHPSPHRSFLVGIGRGAELVDDLPGRGEWQESWLAGAITESDKYREVRRSLQGHQS